MPKKIKNSNNVKKQKLQIKLGGSEKIVRKTVEENIFEIYWINYLTEFNLSIDILLILYVFCAKIFFFFALLIYGYLFEVY